MIFSIFGKIREVKYYVKVKIEVMKKFVFLAVIGILFIGCGSSKVLIPQGNAPVVVHLDLVNVVDDQVMVTVDPGQLVEDAIAFYIPKTVPGTYSTDNYGQYIEGFKAYDYKGSELSVSQLDPNTWRISDAKKLDKVTYYVNDTYDTELRVAEKVFSPAGTNILEGKNFMLNLHGFVGYFSGLEETPYTLQITKPVNLKATTSLQRKTATAENNSIDVFEAKRYFEVTDSPIMYAKAPSVSFQIKDIEVSISVYSPNNTVTAMSLKDKMEKMMTAQKAFLGDINSTKEYNILLYLSTLEEDDATGFGALEHHTSTVVVLPEQMPKEELEEAMVDVVSHEFFHTLTPLNVHSKEIQYFNFNDPKMSQHLWMYEGVTEYFANLFQIQQGLIDKTEFYERIMGKMQNAQRYDDTMSFTVMSKNILSTPYKENYANVYEKGTLIGMVLDLILLESSKGELSLLGLMKELSKKYDEYTPFDDDALIDEIVSMTFPEVRDFFDTHVIGTTPIAYETYLEKVGLAIAQIEQETGYFLDGNMPFIDVDVANGNTIFIREGIALNSFFLDLGAQGGDRIKTIDGKAINLEAIRPIIGESFSWTADRDIEIVVERDDNEITLHGKVGAPTVERATIIESEQDNNPQVQLRNLWLKQ
ncbi:peptidase M61 [Arenibacter sp. GZD96]|uniref:M61 family metallopeptidase n=1 Tax=Aurantibrevibacter litoralis TaxID=3106030 RepID=UPI002AFE3170|nr:hypothetical protein [Arenibacter sp. GZD-96]MEA1784566.1 peptidase M61 [Arenibacter sp. GZD-96]